MIIYKSIILPNDPDAWSWALAGRISDIAE